MTRSFVDEVTIEVRGGDGGDGSASFAREKYKPKGGPDGGDGGHGGSVVLVAEPATASLAAYVRSRHHRAASGSPGASRKRRGADGGDLRLPVPVGTVVRESDGETLADLARPGVGFKVGRGGRGGRGNASLASGAERAPNFAERGEPGGSRSLILELRLVADVGLLGPPNAGKSTLLGRISRAHPKVGAYPFTTIDPSLGVVEAGEDRLTVADLPGLIEGAAEGRGLGLRFLRHAERCSVLAAVVDLAAPDPAADLEAVEREVRSFSPELAERIRVVVGNKIDLDAARAEPAAAWAAARGARLVEVSGAESIRTAELVAVLAEEVRRAHAEHGEPESFAVYRPVEEDPIVVTREEDAFRVQSRRVERLVGMTPIENSRAVRHLQRRLKALGVEAALSREGAREGDEVRIGEMAFEYLPEER